MDTIWIGAHDDVRTGQQAEEALASTNDCRFLTEAGVVKVDDQRWAQAQRFELNYWMSNLHAASDRNDEHAHYFNAYQELPEALGAVLEVGCGPFTQIGTIVGNGHRAKSIALLDPLIKKYLEHPNCSYRTGALAGLQVRQLPLMIEELRQCESFDTVVSINVLEHVLDAPSCISRIIASLRRGGHLVFHDRSWDSIGPERLYDVGHPIRLRYATIQDRLDGFYTVYRRDVELRYGRGIYFIGRKK